MTTGVDARRPAVPVAVGVSRQSAAKVFGPSFDRLLLTSYEDLVADVVGRDVSFIGVAAEPGMADSLAWALSVGAEQPGVTIAVEMPGDSSLSDEVRAVMADAGVGIVGVRRYADRPCLVLGDVAAVERDDSWLVGCLLDAALTAPDARRAAQERRSAEWELAAARSRSEEFEVRLRETARKLSEARGELRQLQHSPQRTRDGRRGADQAGRSGPPVRPRFSPRGLAYAVSGVFGAEGRRGRMITLGALAVATLVPVAVLAVLLGVTDGAGGVVAGAALGALLGLLLVVAGLQGVVLRSVGELQSSLRANGSRQLSATRHGQRAVGDLVQKRFAALEVMLEDQAESLAALPTETPVTEPEVTRLVGEVGDRVQATQNLFALVPPVARVPALSGFAAAPDVLALLVEELVRVRPRVVVESGSGASTLFLALAAEKYGIDARLVALEHDLGYARDTRALLARHGVADRAEVRHAPLARTRIPDHSSPWYDEAAVADLSDVGLVFVDGPPAFLGPAARYPMIPLLRDKLAERCTIIVDDVRRAEDQAVADRWVPLLDGFSHEQLPLIRGAAVFRR